MKSSHRTVDGVDLVRLARTEWRVNDATDPDRLLGYIERQRSDRWEIMWMTDPMRWGYATSFAEALGAFGDSVRFKGDIFDRRASVVVRERVALSRMHRSTWVKPNRRSDVA
jgi:hypothetical protein